MVTDPSTLWIQHWAMTGFFFLRTFSGGVWIRGSKNMADTAAWPAAARMVLTL